LLIAYSTTSISNSSPVFFEKLGNPIAARTDILQQFYTECILNQSKHKCNCVGDAKQK